jgi:hypothetical protein
MSDEYMAVIIVAIIFGGAFSVAITVIVAGTIRKVMQTRAREESRREIAAYVAEGSIAPDDAARLMEAGSGSWKNMTDRLR